MDNKNNTPNGFLCIFRSTILKRKPSQIEHLSEHEQVVQNPSYIEFNSFNREKVDNHWKVTLKEPIQGHQDWFVPCQDSTIFINISVIDDIISTGRKTETIPPPTPTPINIPGNITTLPTPIPPNLIPPNFGFHDIETMPPDPEGVVIDITPTPTPPPSGK